VRGLSAIALVLLENGLTRPASEVDLPLGDERMTWQDVHRLGAALDADRVPLMAIAEDCSIIAAKWTNLLADDDALTERCVLTPTRVIDEVKEVGSLQALSELLELDLEKTIGWLNGLISAVAEKHRPAVLDGIIPDQTDGGTFRSNAELRDGSEIDDALRTLRTITESRSEGV